MEERKFFPAGTILADGSWRYRIEAPAGCGGSAIIYRATQYPAGEKPECGRKILLKEIYPAQENGSCERTVQGEVISKDAPELLEEMRERLKEEERAGAELKDRSFLVCNLKRMNSPHLDGETTILRGLARMPDMNRSAELLADWMNRWFGQTMEKKSAGANVHRVEEALKLLDGAAESLQRIHRAGYLYCDFSPGNVFILTHTHTVVFIDLGCVVKCPYQEQISVWNYIPATWGYRAPELCRTGLSGAMQRTVSAASDVYSLTAFLYQLIRGQAFADAENEFERSIHPEKRVIGWEEMCGIGVTDPVSALLLNDLFLQGLAFETWNRTADIRRFREKLETINGSLRRTSLYDRLAFLWEKGYGSLGNPYEEKRRRFRFLLARFFETAVPETSEIRAAVQMLEGRLKEDAPIQKQIFILYWLSVWLQKKQKKTEETEFLLHYCGVALYNNLGACAETIAHYEACMGIASPLDVMSYLGLRLRGAENYANFFAYRKAWTIVKKNCALLQERKRCYQHMAEQLLLPTGRAECTTEYGKNLSAAGRYLAFLGAEKKAQGKVTSAMSYFRKSRKYFEAALEEFQGDPKNQRRVCCSLLQMAVAAEDEELFGRYLLEIDVDGEKPLKSQMAAMQGECEARTDGRPDDEKKETVEQTEDIEKNSTENKYLESRKAENTEKESLKIRKEENTEKKESGKRDGLESRIQKEIGKRVRNPRGQNLYDLHVLLKGMRVFCPGKPSDSLADLMMELLKLAEKTPDSADANPVEQHPWELIFKEAAILMARYHGQVGETEHQLFALAAGGASGRARVEACLKKGEEAGFSTLTILSLAALAQEKVCEIRYGKIKVQEKAGDEAEARRKMDEVRACETETKRCLKETDRARAEVRIEEQYRALEELLDTLYQYVRRHKCGFLKPQEWKNCSSVWEKYALVRSKLIYEYD